jgi:ABC-type molybdate transport system substrate-binding protein
MPTCPNCGSTYEPGVAVCADCDVPLVGDQEYEKIKAVLEELHGIELAVLEKTPNQQEAMAWRDFLLSLGFKVLTEPAVGYVNPLPASPISSDYKLLVPKEDFEEARKELEAYITAQPGDAQTEAEEDNSDR